MPTQPWAARRRLNDSSQPESQASQAGTKRPAARSPARKPRTADLSSAAMAGRGLAGSFDEFSPFPPIADYAFLSDCEVTALVAPSGSVEWMCLPKMDGPSVFGAVLDRDAGWFRFGPDDVAVPSDRRYLPGTMVLETSWDCGQGWLVVRECLVMGPWQHDHPHGSTHVRPPTDYDAEHLLLRTVRCVDGQAQLTLDCVPAFDYGRQHARWRHTERGYTQAVVEPEGLDLTLTLTSDIRLGLEGSSAR